MVRHVTSTGVVSGGGYRRYALRLGTDVFRTGAVTRQSASELLTIFEDIAQRMRTRGVDKYRAVATSAMRDAHNGPSLVKRIKRKTGIELEIIDGQQELRLARSVLLKSLGSAPPETLLVDLGGGSLEIERADRQMGMSLPFGTVRVLERFPQLGSPMELGELGRIRALLRDELSRELKGPRRPVPLAVGTGGNLDVMSRLMPVRGCPVAAIDVSRLPAFASRVAAMTTARRVRTFGVRPDRADLMVPAVLVIQGLVDLFGLNAFVVPGTGIRESVLQELVGQPQVHAAARQILTRFGQDPARADRISRSADKLFDLLAPVHGLWAPARGPMQAAAYLCELGNLIDPEDAVRHSVYMVHNLSELPLDSVGRRLAATVIAMTANASRTRKAALRRRLSARDRGVADILSGIVEMATCLEQHGRVRRLGVDILSNPLVLTATGASIPNEKIPGALGRAIGRKVRVL